MKLYNIFEEVILEEITKNSQIISEGVSSDAVKAAIRDKVNVNIEYQDYVDQPPSKRYIQVYNYASTKANNDSIRAYQISGGSKSKKPSNWKIFLLDKIVGWYPTNMKWQNPVSDYDTSIPAYNQLGDRTMSQVFDKVNPDTFTRQRSDINQNPNLQDNEEDEEF
jgi:hypothetical protein